MAVRKPAPSTATSAKRRTRLGALTLLTLTASLGTSVVLNLLAARFDYRWDVTAGGDQRLADRTVRVLNTLTAPARVVIAADLREVDSRARDRVSDVLAEMRRRTRNLRYTIIDSGSPRGVEQYREIVGELVDAERPLLREQSASIELGASGAASLAAYLNDTLSPALIGAGEGVSAGTPEGQAAKRQIEQDAARARLLARDLAKAATDAADLLKARLGEIELPATDRAARALSTALGATVDQLDAMVKSLEAFLAGDASAGPARDQARPLVRAISERRDSCALLFDSMRRLKRPDVLRLVEVLRGNHAALVIGPEGQGVTAIDLDALYPSAEFVDASGAVRADLSRRAEELLATALINLSTPVRPVVVLTHAEARAFLGEVQIFEHLRQRLALRGIDLIEWPAALQTEPPALAHIDPDRTRPVVYLSLCPEASAPAGTRGELSGAQRADRLGSALNALITQGKPVLLSLAPSVLPTYGEADPIARVLDHFGLVAETGRPVLSDRVTAQGRQIETDRVLFAIDSAHPISGALRGVPTKLPWPIHVHEKPLADKARTQISWLFSIPADDRTWGETQWLRLRQTPRAQRSLLPDAPAFDEGRDARWPDGSATGKPQSWNVAAAVERYVIGAAPQRLVVVGSNDWFVDAVTQELVEADGRLVPANPGNLELFEASVYWLAGQDNLISQSPSARVASMVAPIDATRLIRLQYVLVLGLPLGVLALGGIYLLMRR